MKKFQNEMNGLPRVLREVASLYAFAIFLTSCLPAFSQDIAPSQGSTTKVESLDATEAVQPQGKVDVNPTARDDQIRDRLSKIMQATQWFRETEVRVEEGVVFLHGRTKRDRFKEWAGNLARNVQDVVSVVNQIEVDDPSIWDTTAVQAELTRLSRSLLSGIPIFAFSVLVLALAAWLSMGVSRFARNALRGAVKTDLLRQVAAKSAGLILFFLALYLVLQVAGLTRLALTLAGGTGLLGLAIGIAFKDISENFLASLYLSLRKPFEIGDLIEVNSMLGYVQRVTSRTTILLTLEGNHVQIPNATVFKNILVNYTSNPFRRVDFLVGIGYDDAILHAQAIAVNVLREHPAVLRDPEPWVLVDSLGASTVNLRVYFWLDGNQHSWLKVRSAVIRLTKSAFQQAGISLPDESREVVFPQGVPVQITERHAHEHTAAPDGRRRHAGERAVAGEPAASTAEGNLTNEAAAIKEQAKDSRMPEQGENLISE